MKTIQVLRKWATSQSIYHFSWDLFTLGYQVFCIIIISKNVSSGVESQLLYAKYQVLSIMRHIRLLLSLGCMVPSILNSQYYLYWGVSSLSQYWIFILTHVFSIIYQVDKISLDPVISILNICKNFFVRYHINNII